MCRRSRGWLIGTALTIAFSPSTPLAQGHESPFAVVRLENDAKIPPNILTEAQEHVVHIYELIGVNVMWGEQPTDDATNRLIVKIVPNAAPHVRTGALGLALLPSGSSGRVAYVFYDRVAAVASSHRIANGSLLGATIAHELGHLLLPYGHSANGLMQGRWDDFQLLLARAGVLRFTSRQGELIRARLTAR